ncbi:MAG: hypothetical protein ACR2QT_01135 [Woeseiaceae bacterium]
MFTKPVLWRICCGIVVAISIFAFTPYVLAPGEHQPELFGVPRTLWLGILIAFALVGMTYIGGLVHPANDTDPDTSRDDSC